MGRTPLPERALIFAANAYQTSELSKIRKKRVLAETVLLQCSCCCVCSSCFSMPTESQQCDQRCVHNFLFHSSSESNVAWEYEPPAPMFGASWTHSCHGLFLSRFVPWSLPLPNTPHLGRDVSDPSHFVLLRCLVSVCHYFPLLLLSSYVSDFRLSCISLHVLIASFR